ncbi:SGNH hydrolase-like domain-containing protein, acetyltransferase AlgX [Actinosynnema pretiosum]|nr:SGNH hydrolase-like domain-containing protein, acetyltransferase AlgX [Actinosynnema pretiosum]
MLPRDHALYRPRHSGRQRTALSCLGIFFFVPVLLAVVGVRPPEFENRPLTPFPSPSDGFGFFTGMGKWATDHLPLRDHAVTLADSISRGVFQEPYPFGQRHEGGPIEGGATKPEDESLDGVEIPRTSGFPLVVEGRDDWLYLGYDIQAACATDKTTEHVMGQLNKLRQGVESTGRKFVLTVAPNKTTAVPEQLPDSFLGSKCYANMVEQFWAALPTTGAIDLRPGLEAAAAKAGGPVYFKNDTHWTHDGGLVMVRALADAIQPGATASWKFSAEKDGELVGDLPKLVGRTQHSKVKAYKLAPDGENVRSKAVTDDFKQPRHYTQAPTKGTVKAKVGLIGDSFSFTMASYFVGGFADITMIHSELFNDDVAELGRRLADQDVVVLEAVERGLVSGTNPILNDDAIDELVAELAKKPRR